MRNGDRSDQISSCVVFATLGVLLPLSWTMLYRYLERSPHLLVDAAEVAYMRQGTRQSIGALVVFPIAAAFSVVSPLISLVTFVAMPLFFIAVLVQAPDNEADAELTPANAG
jgi:hypothetical protein